MLDHVRGRGRRECRLEVSPRRCNGWLRKCHRVRVMTGVWVCGSVVCPCVPVSVGVCVYVTLTLLDCLGVVHFMDTLFGEWPRACQNSLQIRWYPTVHEVPRA